MKNNSMEQLVKNMLEFDIQVSDEQINQFQKYYELLIEWNSIMNLTGIVEYDEVLIKHFLDSASFAKAISIKEDKKIIDMGTGAGFPGIPLKILFPFLHITLVDSVGKKINFLNDVIEKLHLENISTIHARAEDLARLKEHRESYDYCVSRAVANLSTLSEYCIPYVKEGGMFISYKSEKAEEELSQAKKAIYLLGGQVDHIDDFHLPSTDIRRVLISIKKIRKTPVTYPRKAGLPAKNPLG